MDERTKALRFDEWRRWRIDGVHRMYRSIALPGGGVLLGHVIRGHWEVTQQRIELGRSVVAAGTFRGPLRVGCDAADASMSAILWAARERASGNGGRDG